MSVASEKAPGWALKLALASADAARALRLLAGVEVAEGGGFLWLRGRVVSEELHRRLPGLPALERYMWHADGRLQPETSLLATERMPELAWAPLQAWARPEPPPARLPAAPPARPALRLVPAGEARGATVPAMLLDFAVWRDWALRAPLARLEPLSFAVSEGHALVLGAPAPAAPGRHLIDLAGVLIPAGFVWEPALSPTTLRRVCSAAEEEVVWWDEEGLRVLGRELFVPATRANVRASARAVEEAARA